MRDIQQPYQDPVLIVRDPVISRTAADYFLRFLPPGVPVTEKPEEARLRIIFDSYDNGTVKRLPVSYAYRTDTVMYSENDSAMPVIPGIYVSLRKRHARPGRFQSYAYLSYLAETNGNPFCKGVIETRKINLACFTGRNSIPFRRRLFEGLKSEPGFLVRDTSSQYSHWEKQGYGSKQEDYVRNIRESWFSICPKGNGVSSIRLFESMRLGVAPVILSDGWTPPNGPDWEACSIRVPEADWHHLPEILENAQPRAALIGRNARKEYEKHFSPKAISSGILQQLINLDCNRSSMEPLIRSQWLARYYASRGYWFLYFSLTGIRNALRKR